MAASSSINLSDFFKDDESGGLRFLDFIKKRQGGIRRQNVLFMDREVDRLSLDVRLEKLQTPQLKQAENNLSLNKINCLSDENLNETATGEKLSSDSPAADNFKFTKPQDLPARTATEIQHTNFTTKKGLSPNIPDIRKSSGDRLRRLSFKNYSGKKNSCRKRTSLQEFDNEVEGTNFNPSVCSTPVSQSTQNVSKLSINTNTLPETENIDPNNGNCSITRRSCCNHNKLKDCMESIIDKTLKQIENQSNLIQNSCTDSTIDNRTKSSTASKRTFTIEKGNIPGQLILTPDKSGDQNTRISNVQQAPNENHKIRKLSTSQYCNNNCKAAIQKRTQVLVDCSVRESVISEVHKTKNSNQLTQKDPEVQETQNENSEIQNTSCNDLSIISPTQNVEIPETQAHIKDHPLRICSDKEQHIVVIPFSQTISELSSQESKNNIGKSGGTKANSCSSSVQNQSFKQIENNLKLSDILTDDEETTYHSILQNVSEIPLNLAPSGYNIRKKRLQKRPSQLHNNMKLVSESEVEIPFQAHSNRLVQRNKFRVVNKPPGVPLNGEQYAKELARMSNYEILDLRKRNSKDKIFGISDRRTSFTSKEANEKKHQLDDQFGQELLKRNLNNIAQHKILPSDPENIENVTLPVPYNFRDTVTTRENLIDKSSFDQIKYKGNKMKSRMDETGLLPEILKHVDRSKNYSFGKRRKSNSRTSRRSLFKAQSLDQGDQVESITENRDYTESTSTSILNKLGFRYLKSPPQNFSVTTPKVVSPPLAIATTCEIQDDLIKTRNDIIEISTSNDVVDNTHSKTYTDLDENLTLPPPPPGFENDSTISVHYNINQYTTNITFGLGATNENVKTNNDDHLFKMPTKPAPKRNIKNIGKSLNVSDKFTRTNQRSIDSSADLTESSSLRRSQRGQVPRRPEPIFDIFYQYELKRTEEYEKTKKNRVKKQRKELKRTKSTTSNSTIISKRTENELSNTTENASVLSDSSQGTKIVERKNFTRIKSKRTDDIILSQNKHKSAASVEHLNNLFVQLKQNNLPSTATTEHSHQIRPQNNIKALKVRVRRLKPIEINGTVTSTNVSCTSTYSNTSSNSELVCWLKNISETSHNNQQETINAFDARISSARNLHFIELQGLEYAFYDNVESRSVGYLRFKPQQIKPIKKAKRFSLQFINLMGLFRIAVNNSKSILSVGDMLIIEKSAYYGIENLSKDIGILMVMKI